MITRKHFAQRVLAASRGEKHARRMQRRMQWLSVALWLSWIVGIGVVLWVTKPKPKLQADNREGYHFLPSNEYESSEALNDDGVPAHLHISGQRWDVTKVVAFDDAVGHKPGERFAAKTAQTICSYHVIQYIDTRDPIELRASLAHEIFHAGACEHGGARWWNSRSDKRHEGIYHLGEFTAQFMHDNPVYVKWMTQSAPL